MRLFGWLGGKKKAIEPGPEERRILPRWKISTQAKIKWAGQNDYLDCQIKDLNLKGFALAFAKTLPQDCSSLTIYFNEKYFFTADIVIIWHKMEERRNIYGIRFSRIRDPDKEKIFQMLREDFPEHFGKL